MHVIAINNRNDTGNEDYGPRNSPTCKFTPDETDKDLETENGIKETKLPN